MSDIVVIENNDEVIQNTIAEGILVIEVSIERPRASGSEVYKGTLAKLHKRKFNALNDYATVVND